MLLLSFLRPRAAPAESDLVAENAQLRQELAAAQAQIGQLQTALAGAEAEKSRLQSELAQAQATMAQLAAELGRLRQENTELKQAPFTPRRRHTGVRQPAPTPKRRGRAAGHVGSGRQRPQRVDRRERIPLAATCPDCGTPFAGRPLERVRVVEDIEPVRPTVITQYTIERRWCAHCQAFKEAPVAAALPGHRLGLRTLLFVVYQKVALGLSYGKIQHELATYFGLRVSQGELVRMVATLARLFGPAYARLIRLLRQQAAVHVDETGWRVDGVNHWLWVFVNEVVALYVLSHSRGSKVPRALLGPDFAGVVISDFFSAYSPLAYAKAKCWSHLLRDSHDLTKGPAPPAERVQFHTQLHQLFLDMGLALQEVAADEAGRERIYQELRTQLLTFAQQPWCDADCQRLAKRIRDYLEDLLVWLRHPAVSPDNNAAERALRPAVVTRKTSFGSRSPAGAQAFARLLSLIETWKRQDQDFFATAQATVAAARS
jgi:transposase